MNAGLIVFIVIVAAVAAGASVLRRRADRVEAYADPGPAILEFGAAFPEEAVRDVVMTADGRSAFLRLADGRTGFVQSVGNRYHIRMIAARSVRVDAPAGGRSLSIGFEKTQGDAEPFRFASIHDAAEVSLWLCGGLLVPDAGERMVDR